jgi:pimeloyl-ACP methyl ester carboxylesterase
MSRFFQYNAGNIHYTDQGKGSAIVLIHGYLETSEIWNSFVKRLSKNFRIITLDLPGHGRSDMYNEVYTMGYMAACVANLLEHLQMKKAFVTGHSLGGYITLAFADLYPEMLSGYCLFHSQPLDDNPDTIEKRNTEIDLVKKGKKDMFIPGNITKLYATANLHKFSEALLRSKEIALKIPGETIISVLKGMIARPSRVSIMESGRIPCLWILGAFDNLISCEAIQAKVRLPENAELAILKNSGHMGFIEEEELSIKIISEFLKRHKQFSP